MKSQRNCSVFVALAGALALSATLAFAQKTGGTTPPSSGTTTPTPTTPTVRTPTTTPSQQTTRPDFSRPIFLSGRVVYDDGTPANNVSIERYCNGSRRPEGYTNSKGYFSIQLGQSAGVIADASMDMSTDPLNPRRSSGFGDFQSSSTSGVAGGSLANLMGCEIRAAVSGYTSDSIPLAGRRSLDNPDIGVIVLHNLEKVKGFTVSMADATAPKNARKSYERALKEKGQGKPDKAVKDFEKAVELHPKYASAWYELGMIYMNRNDAEKATECLEKALDADDRFVAPLVPLAGISLAQRNYAQTVERTSRAISLNPYLPMAFYYQSMARVQQQKYEEAEKDATEAARLDVNHRMPKVYYILGIAQANRGNFAHAIENLNLYLKYAPETPDAPMVKQQLARMESEQQRQQAAQAPAATPQP